MENTSTGEGQAMQTPHGVHTGGAQLGEKAGQTPPNREFSNLHRQLEVLHKACNILGEKLTPVSTPAEPVAEAKGSQDIPPAESAMVSDVQTFSREVIQARMKIDDIISRLTI